MKAGERAREETDSERRRPGALHRRFAVKDKVISTSPLWGFQRTLLSAPLPDGARLPDSKNQNTGASSSSTTQTNRMKCLKLSISPELGADAMGTPRGSVSRLQKSGYRFPPNVPQVGVSGSGSPRAEIVVWSLHHFGRQTSERTVDDAAAFIPLARVFWFLQRNEG